jgi:hypothetical protein
MCLVHLKQALTIVFAVTLLSLILLLFVAANTSAGVKPGDWAEYSVTITGTPEAGHDATWARMEVDSVDAAKVNVTFTSTLSNGTTVTFTENLDFAAGHFIDYYLIPASSNMGDSYCDQAFSTTASITNQAMQQYAGHQRLILLGATAETRYSWDKVTGVLVEAKSVYPTFTVHTVLDRTNLWSTQPTIFGVPAVVLCAGIFVALVLVVLAALALVRARASKHSA